MASVGASCTMNVMNRGALRAVARLRRAAQKASELPSAACTPYIFSQSCSLHTIGASPPAPWHRSTERPFIYPDLSICKASTGLLPNCTSPTILTRHFGKQSAKSARRRKTRRREKDNVPFLRDTLRKLYPKVHPDLFTRYPEEQKVNEESFQKLMGFLDTIEKDEENPFPPTRNEKLPFHLRTAEEGKFKFVTLHLKTNGGDCKRQVQATFEAFLVECGLPAHFKWAEGTWGAQLYKRPTRPAEDAYEDQAAGETPEEAASSGNDEQAAANSFNMEEILDQMDEVCKAIASAPFTFSGTEETKNAFMESLLFNLEERGWNLRSAVTQIWEGERDVALLSSGLDVMTAQVVNRIVLHTLSFDAMMKNASAESESFR